MASSSVERGAARALQPPDQLAFFYKLVDKGVIAGALCRHARDAELSASAAVQAEALFGGDSLVVAHLRMGESQSITNLAIEASGAEQQMLDRHSWAGWCPLSPFCSTVLRPTRCYRALSGRRSWTTMLTCKLR